MQILQGTSIAPGFVEGKAFVYSKKQELSAPKYNITPGEISDEHRRLHRALEQSVSELKDVEKKVLTELGQAESQIFAAHLALLNDRKFIAKIKERIRQDLVNVEHAINEEVEDFAQLFCELENEYMRERAGDVKDLGRRILKHLGHGPQELLYSIPPGSVIVAEELLPSDTLHMDRDNVSAVVTERGGESSHMAILTRSLGIPAVSGISNACLVIPDGAEVLVNGETGTVTLNPSKNTIDSFHVSKDKYNHDSTLTVEEEDKKCVTTDGVDVALMANIGRVEETEEVLKHNLDGVGLYRTEYLFLRSTSIPSFDAQVKAYSEVAEKLGNMPVVIRTLDLGGDKKPQFLGREFENNPNMGSRGLRFSLSENQLLKTQLEAIAATCKKYTNVQVLFPMVMGGNDLRLSIEKLKESASGLEVGGTLKVGAMIETPSALFELDEILEQVNFVSIGTNDLAQFMLAADRNALDLTSGDPALYPSVLRAVKKVADAADRKNCAASVCGEAAGEPSIACLFVGLGLRKLSMSPVRAARVRYALRKCGSVELEELARKALNCENVQSIESLLFDFQNKTAGKKQIFS
jgi:phosphoenolpyruvate-protein phosphotransferase